MSLITSLLCGLNIEHFTWAIEPSLQVFTISVLLLTGIYPVATVALLFLVLDFDSSLETMAAVSDQSSGRAVRGASLLILLQVGSRAITFIANQLLLRYLTAELLGVSAQLEVYYLSVLFFARESLRVAIQRQGDDINTKSEKDEAKKTPERQSRSTQAVVNVSYISIALGGLVALVFGYLYLASVNQSTLSSTPYLALSLYIYAAATMTELLSEPAFVVMQIRLQFAVRARAEAVATFLRCLVTLSPAVWAARSGIELGVLPFALGQASYSLSLLGVYVWYGTSLASSEGFSLLPIKLLQPGKDGKAVSKDIVMSYFYRPTLQLASSMMAQSIVKHVLTQGDTFLVSILSTPAAQGVYALANNYGGLIARLLFQPIEESSRSYFSRLLASTDDTNKDGESTSEVTGATRQAKTDLQSLLKVYGVLGLVVTTLGPTAAPVLLSLIAGPRWAGSGAGTCLSAYAWYIPFLAINGVSEAFVASVATEAQVHTQSAWMTAFSLLFGAAGFVCLRILQLGAVGLVAANTINMFCRIVWCIIFIKHFFNARGVEFDLIGTLPGPWTILASVVTSGVVRRVASSAATRDEITSPREILVTLVKIALVAVPYLAVL
jgi:oligosaccharide translocation protein RFT1